jgi:cytochrome c biogenesis protein
MSDNSSGAASASIRPQAARAVWELLASMRFAISLLTVICIASVIGTVLKQHEPMGNYVNQFGPFWAQLFLALKLNAVYSAWWFLLILAFLVVRRLEGTPAAARHGCRARHGLDAGGQGGCGSQARLHRGP